MTIVERALELVEDGSTIGLGSGRAAQAFVRALGERVRGGAMRIRGVATWEETAALARQVGVPLVTLKLFVSDNGNQIIDCEVAPIMAPDQLEQAILAIPGVIDTGLFLGMANVTLVGDDTDFRLIEERQRAVRA